VTVVQSSCGCAVGAAKPMSRRPGVGAFTLGCSSSV
jgi:hypothetical protein